MPWSENTVNYRYNNINFKIISYVFVAFALMSLATAFFFNINAGKVTRNSFSSQSDAIVGPIYVHKHKDTYNVEVRANIPNQSWAFVEGEVLDSQGEYLFAFGKELWRESGCGHDGCWKEASISYDLKVSFPEPGRYYLKFLGNPESNTYAPPYTVTVSKKNGSVLPHLWFGLFNFAIALLLGAFWQRGA